jgi:DNA-binding PadR family transcriptional regulator
MDAELRGFLPLPAAPFHILVALTAGENHGYALMSDVETLSDGSVRMGPGTLYGTLKRLVEQGLVEESLHRPDPETDDERRRYYRLTALGSRVCAAEAERLASLARVARRNLRPGLAT